MMSRIRLVVYGGIVALTLSSIPAAHSATLGPPRVLDDLVEVINAIFGDHRADYFRPNDLVAHQILEPIEGGPATEVSLGDGVKLIAGCKLHSCPEKSAVVIGPGPRVYGAAILHFHCRSRITNLETRTTREDCDTRWSLAVYLANDLSILAYGQALYDWARGHGFTGDAEVTYFTQH